MWDRKIYREQVSRLLIALIWLAAPIAAGVAWGLDGPWEMVCAAAVGVALWRPGSGGSACRAPPRG